MCADEGSPKTLAELLVSHRGWLAQWLGRGAAAGVLRFESAEDLVQAVCLRALEGEQRFEYQGDAAFRGWLEEVARRVVANRHAYWRALKRDAGVLLRLGPDSGNSGVDADPEDPRTGPVTFADRREHVRLSVRALGTLLPRDQQIIRWVREGRTTAEMADFLGTSTATAERARLRAVDRFFKAFRVLRGA